MVLLIRHVGFIQQFFLNMQTATRQNMWQKYAELGHGRIYLHTIELEKEGK